jgi:cathepsin D
MGEPHIVSAMYSELTHINSVMGMGFPSISTLQASPFFMTAMQSGSVQSGEFAFKLSDSGSELYLGGTDNSLYTGDIEYYSVDPEKGYWQISNGVVKVNGVTLEPTFDSIIDTGTTLIYGPSATVEALWGQVPGSNDTGNGAYSYPCDSPPTVSFNFGGSDWDISPDK